MPVGRALVVVLAAQLAVPFGLLGCQNQSDAPAAAAVPEAKLSTPAVHATGASETKRREPRAVPAHPAAAKARIFALDTRVYIRERPSEAAPEIGALRIGQGLPLRAKQPKSGPGCPAVSSGNSKGTSGWLPVEPFGFVCLDRTTTLDPKHPLVLAKAQHQADYERDAPLRWGESLEAPIYRRYPTAKDQARSEYQLDKHQARLTAVREAEAKGEAPPARALARIRGASAALPPDPAPEFLASHQESPWVAALWPGDQRARMAFVPARSTVAWTDEFSAGGRAWLLTPELTLIPKDRILEHKPSTFKGVALGDTVSLPLAFIRREAATAWELQPRRARDRGPAQASASRPEQAERRGAAEPVEAADDSDTLLPASVSGDDAPEDTGGEPEAANAGAFRDDTDSGGQRLVRTTYSWPRLGHVELTGRSRWQRGQRYFETKDGGRWLAQTDAGVVSRQEPRGIELQASEKWLDISIYQGTLVAYVGSRPVFATLISPGANGYKSKRGPDRKNTTPSGTFRMEWKHLSTTMSPDPERKRYYLTDVPFTQFFHMPFALHAAYWHDQFGEPMSGGCVNLSVADARWLFDWTLPALPAGWHSVRSGGSRGEGTWVRIR